jgi:cell division protein FtsW
MKRVAVVLCVTALALLTFGFVMLTSTSSFYAEDHYQGDTYHFAKRQAMWLGLGLATCALTACVDYRRYRKLAWPLFIAAAVSLVLVLIFGRRVNGAMRWFAYGPFRFQPSEFAKYALVIVLAFWLEKIQRAQRGQLHPKIQHWWWGVFAPLSITGVLAALILKEPDLGTTLLLGAVALLLMWLAGSPRRWLAGIVGVGGAGTAAFLVAILVFGMFQSVNQVQRIVHWWRGDDLYGFNYQQYMAKLAFGLGGLWGVGLGDSRQKLAYLPEAHTDFIFPIIGEELGLFFTLAIVASYLIICICGFVVAMNAKDRFGRLLGFGCITMILIQACVNIGMTTAVLPNKGMPLPFISFGGSNLMICLFMIGMLINIHRHGHPVAAPVGRVRLAARVTPRI